MHGNLVQDILYLVELGASNVQALRAATSYGAQTCGIGHETGSLAPGKLADVIVVGGNPLEDPGTLRNIMAVFKNGKLMHGHAFRELTGQGLAHGAHPIP